MPADERSTQIGLLMEAALTHQRAAEDSLAQLQVHMQGLDSVVRDEIRRTFVEELQGLHGECRRASQSLQTVKRSATVRMGIWSLGITAVCFGGVICATAALLPSRVEIAALRGERDRLSIAVRRLEERGGRIDLRRCGDSARLCVRIDSAEPAFGEHHDYRIVRLN